MYKLLGILNILLLLTITAPYWLRRLGQWFAPGKKVPSPKLLKALRALHKPLGICLLLLTLAHGYLALGSLRLHTGTLAGIMVLITVALGGAFYRKKKARLFQWHKRAALLTVLLTLLHLAVPGALYFIFR